MKLAVPLAFSATSVQLINILFSDFSHHFHGTSSCLVPWSASSSVRDHRNGVRWSSLGTLPWKVKPCEGDGQGFGAGFWKLRLADISAAGSLRDGYTLSLLSGLPGKIPSCGHSCFEDRLPFFSSCRASLGPLYQPLEF